MLLHRSHVPGLVALESSSVDPCYKSYAAPP